MIHLVRVLWQQKYMLITIFFVCVWLFIWAALSFSSALLIAGLLGLVAVFNSAKPSAVPQSQPLQPEKSVLPPASTAAPSHIINAVLEALPTAYILLDRRGLVTRYNRLALDAVPELKIGAAFVLAMRTPPVLEAVDEVLAGGTARHVPFEEKTPIERWYSAYIAPLYLDKNQTGAAPDCVAISLVDLSGQMRLERMRVDFIANASHELRTPLASLTGFIETLQGPARQDSAARDKFLGIMQRQAWRMSRLINDLLSLSRIELHAHIRPKTLLDLRQIVAQTVDALVPVAQEQNAKMLVDAPQTPVFVLGERDELVRVAENLIENAIKYGQQGGDVRIFVGATAPNPAQSATAFMRVCDTGAGIAPEHLPRLTERFYRVDAPTSRERGGTGLGLALVKHILNRHRGRLEIESVVGKGSTFTARFELAPSPLEEA